MGAAEQAAVIAFLGDPASHGGAPVERIETHGAIVFLAGERAYKIKRAVRYPYLDFSTLEKRHAACAAELRLNRRTAPSLYLDLRPVTRRSDGRLALGGEGEPVEWVVVMRRFDQDRLFDRMAEAGTLTRDLILDLADRVAAFHAAAELAPAGSDWGGSAVFRATLLDNLDELGPPWFAAARIEALRAAALAALDRTAPLLDRRKAEGRIRRCHGDLHLRNIVLLDGRPTLFDAIEFNDALAWIDLFDDAAFLLMDLDHRRLRPLANLFLNRYALRTGDWGGLAALPLFLCNRALVRAKVAATTARLTGDAARIARLRAEAAAYLDAAERYVRPPPAVLVAVGGVSGTGKTSLAARLAPGIGPAPGAVHLRTDVLRKRMFGLAETERLPQDAYRSELHDRVFREMFAVAREVLAAGHAAILDGVFGEPAHREAAAELAREAGTPFAGLWLDAPEETLVARVAARTGDASDATPEVVRRQLAADFGPIGWLRLAAGGPLDTLAADARRRLRGIGITVTEEPDNADSARP